MKRTEIKKMAQHMGMRSLLLMGMITISMLSASCGDDFLDQKPDERIDLSTESDVVKLLMNAYPEADYSWLSEISSDNIIDNNANHTSYKTWENKDSTIHYNLSPYARMDDELFRMEPALSATYGTSDSPGSIWNHYYSSVATANFALEAIDRIAAEQGKLSAKLKAAKGEALLIRAYDHFILANLFSQAYKDESQSSKDIGIPYVTETEDVVQKEYSRSNVAEVYRKIKADLEEGLANISDENYEHPKYHFNTNAAHAFAARFYLYYRQWNKVIEHANAVLGTDSASVSRMLLDYSTFKDCTYSDDYANVWQDPNANNNLLLITTYSVKSRRAAGYRYASNSWVITDLIYHSGPTWPGWRGNPVAWVAGFTFYRSNSEYGFFPAKVAEQFQYTDKVAGIGYAHIIERAFTANVLLLDRAEAKIMTGDYNGAMDDIILYDLSRQSFSESDRATFFANNGMRAPTKELLLPYYSKATNSNCFADWDFTAKNVSSQYVIPAAAVPYMNAVNDMRRFETWMEGQRFFDLKRWGMEYRHKVGVQNEIINITANDKRRALEVPWEALSAGLQSSHDAPADAPQNDVNLEEMRIK